MSFQDIVKVETVDTYLDMAFRRGRETAKLTKQKTTGPKFEKQKTVELKKIQAVNKSLVNSLNKIITTFPAFDQLTPFYKELVESTIDWRQLKKSLGAVNWAKNKIETLYRQYEKKIKHTRETGYLTKYATDLYGRIASVLKQISKELEFLERARRTIRTYPSIKQNMITIALFGFPNVGKTTILTKLTTADPEIAAYPFTTKKLNLGYAKINGKKFQLIDTPGTLNRFDKMNNIEQQASLVLKHVADVVIYIFDLTQPYPLKDQIKLYHKIKSDKKVIAFLSKTDLLEKSDINDFKKKFTVITSIQELKSHLNSLT